ncbi:MAG TPA: calcium-binding protein, partial [Dongiaceae bacterium]|nr:calcium-binding protein [Dongiaceae bacterium]
GDASDLMDGGTGIDIAIVNGAAAGETFTVAANGAAVRFDRTSQIPFGLDIQATERLVISAGGGDDTLNVTGNLAALLSLTVDGGAGNDTLSGGNGNDLLFGGADNDVLEGGAGNDTLDGEAGTDKLAGGSGNDTYVVTDANDTITEAVGEGIDLVLSSVGIILAANVENLILIGADDINGGGNELANVITGNDGSNILIGLAGNDTLLGGGGADILDGGIGNDKMTGGLGDDLYTVDSTKDVVIEAAKQGIDAVHSSINYTLGANVETLVLVGAANLNGTGNILANNLIGNAGSNRLDGGAGDDTLNGELGAVGSDDTLIGGAGNDGLNGGAGNDLMQGGTGNDLYVVDSVGDKVIELAGQGTDIIVTGNIDIDLALFANVENVNLRDVADLDVKGNALNNRINGNDGGNVLDGGAGNDTLDGKAGADLLRGGLGNDIYIIADNADAIIENKNEGIDQVVSSVSFILDDNIENLTLTAGTSGTGNDLANVVIGHDGGNNLAGQAGNDTLNGNGGNDVLDGGVGADRMAGGTGEDTYVVDDARDIVSEGLNQGIDSVVSTVSFTLAANLEQLFLNGDADINGTGNAIRNVIAGNDGRNRLDGGAGNDDIDGRAGNDTLIGGTGNDFLEGGQGVDIMSGGLGRDVFVYEIENVTELANLGGDIINGFQHGQDRINLSDLFNDLGLNGVDAFGGGFLKIDVVGNNTNILFDQNGGGDGFITLATLANVRNITADDIVTTPL